MRASAAINYSQLRNLLPIAGMALFAIMAVLLLPNYIPWSSVNFLLGLAGVPLAIAGAPTGGPSYRLFWWALAGAVVACFFPANFLLLGVLITAMAWQWEQWRGRLPLQAWCMLALMTPALQYVAVMASFPLRLWLTGVAAGSMKLAGINATAMGNIIATGGREYSVDPACMGLKMLVTSLLGGLMVVAVLQKRHQRYLPWWWVLLLLVMVFVLNIVANLLRIVTLVYFDIGPGKMMHELTGLAYLALYVLLPTALVAHLLICRKGHCSTQQLVPTVARRGHYLYLILLAVVILVAVIRHLRTENHQPTPLPTIDGYAVSLFDKDVIRYTGNGLLVYIKATAGILGAEHNPAMCWLGSGYALSLVQETTTQHGTMYTATLVKGHERLYTAWWYDNGAHHTTSQLAWRWQVLTGAHPFSIINVTAASHAELEAATQTILREGTFRPAL